ncbi:RING finger [Pyrenophora seminiperda CCB06]|uniref:RBR-type E3 ubiquitin transferase n=1 Tax=Pyrenophora seminiperda CCB06 TaxID=1302712 RepID=A0A3M7M612_9PLEO|nr:RING finger [Pyrenophora seminiperda CCB06]
MGAKFSRAVRPHVKVAAASPVATSPDDEIDNDANTRGKCQELAPQLFPIERPHCRDDIVVATSTITRTPTEQRRHSAPALGFAEAAADGDMDQSAERMLAMIEEMQERTLERARLLHGETEPGSAVDTVTAERMGDYQRMTEMIREHQLERERELVRHRDRQEGSEPAPAADPVEVKCLACLEKLPDAKDPKHAKEVIKPCRSHDHTYCGSCIGDMFVNACNDITRMPPRCCYQIPIHVAKPHLSKEELDEFRIKYDEWQTPNPFYCPIPTCSTFIPNRLLPQRVDSGVGPPLSKTFACPKCEASICLDCRQVSHPNSICATSEFGIDAETTKLLKGWGYKKCPKCGHGLKRMYGCNHMECLCGAHFCYSCMQEYNQCGGNCNDDDDEDDAYEYGPGEDEPEQGSEEEFQALVRAAQIASEGEEAPREVSEEEFQAILREAQTADPVPASTTPTTTPPRQPVVEEPRNLDAGGQRYWERQRVDFGDEPREDYENRSWSCVHRFQTYPLSLKDALSGNPASTEIECVKCWRVIHPQIQNPEVPAAAAAAATAGVVGTTPGPPPGPPPPPPRGARTEVGRVGQGQGQGLLRGIRRGHQRGGRRGYAPWTPPRGLLIQQTQGTRVGTAPHLTVPVPTNSLLDISFAPSTTPMEDLTFHSPPVNPYTSSNNNNPTTTMPPPPALPRASTSLLNPKPHTKPSPPPSSASSSSISNVFTSLAQKQNFSPAYECVHCDILVCEDCKDAIVRELNKTLGRWDR